jgi:hypothetical protein
MFGHAKIIIIVVIANQQSPLEVINAFPSMKVPFGVFFVVVFPHLQP